MLEAVPLRPLAIEVSGTDRARVEAAAAMLSRSLGDAGLPVVAALPPVVPTLEARPTELGRQAGPSLDQAVADALASLEPLASGDVRLDQRALAAVSPGGLPTSVAGSTHPLGTLVDLTPLRRSAVLERRHGQPAVQLQVGEATAEVAGVERLLAAAGPSLAEGVEARASGGVLDWQEARGELVLALVLGLALVLLVMAALYESFTLATCAMAVLPFAVAGGLAAQRLAGGGLDLGSGLGLVLLGGVAVDSGLLLLDRLRGGEVGPALLARRAAGRLRPVMVTVLTTVATLAPVALAGGAGGSLRVTLARTACVGLLVATPASFLVLPPLALLMGAIGRRRERSVERKR